MKGERYGVNAPLIGPCMGECGVPNRVRIPKPCYPVGTGEWLCHDCIHARQSETAARLASQDASAAVATDGGRSP